MSDDVQFLKDNSVANVVDSMISALVAARPQDTTQFMADYMQMKADGPDYPPTALAVGVKALPDWIQKGCGNDEYICPEKNATFPPVDCPEKMPDLSNHSSFMAEKLRDKPELWDQLRNLKTKSGVTFAKCIKTGVDNPGHPMIKTVGMVAGDEESYETFKALFDPVIDGRHGGYAADAKHPTNTDWTQLSKTKLDPTGKYVLTTRVRTGRSIRGFKLPPSIDFESRRKLEEVVVRALLKLEGDLKGDYYPLHGSHSYPLKPNGMSHGKEEKLRSAGNLFQEPDSTLLLASGMGRHWPDARGIFHNTNEDLFVWLNEEDHMRIVSMEKGDDMVNVFKRFATACQVVQESVKKEGFDFMHSDHLGFILTCPSNLGTGLRAGAMVLIPHVSSRDDFKTICKKMGLQARGGAGVDSASVGGKWDISNADRLGKSEVDLVNAMIEGVAKLVKWEEMLEKGESIDAELPQ
jgi:creatine kinase